MVSKMIPKCKAKSENVSQWLRSEHDHLRNNRSVFQFTFMNDRKNSFFCWYKISHPIDRRIRSIDGHATLAISACSRSRMDEQLISHFTCVSYCLPKEWLGVAIRIVRCIRFIRPVCLKARCQSSELCSFRRPTAVVTPRNPMLTQLFEWHVRSWWFRKAGLHDTLKCHIQLESDL